MKFGGRPINISSANVAIKILPPEFSSDSERVRRFQREAYAVSALKHPNIITIHEIGLVNDVPFIVTELVEGRTLRDQIENSRLGWREAVRVATQIASALNAAHTAGIVHRDIKPENVIVQADGQVKLLDFGIAKWVGIETNDGSDSSGPGAQTQMGVTPGTLKYMSPEQARGENLDPRTDIFSLGLVLYEMIAAQHPFDEIGEEVTVALQSDAEIPPPGGATFRSFHQHSFSFCSACCERSAMSDIGLPQRCSPISTNSSPGQKIFRARNANEREFMRWRFQPTGGCWLPRRQSRPP